jgi:hypothetical protein
LTRFSKHVLFSLLTAALLSPAAFAGNKENPHDTLTKSLQQATPWTQGPVKLVAKLRLPKPDGTDVNLDYTVSWAGPEKWRAEWTANGMDQITILNNGKLYFSTDQMPPFPLLLMEAALEALDGGNPAGPYVRPPVDLEKAKIETSKKKVGAVDAKCLEFGDPKHTYCLDPANGHALSISSSVSNVEFNSFEYSDYTTVGPTSYPQTVKVNYVGKLLEDAKVTLTRGDKFADTLFTIPNKGTTMDWPSCADVDKNFTAPHISKSAPPKMSEAAKKAKKYGLVWVMATVGKDGSVSKATAIGGDPDLNPSAVEAVQQYKFTPYTRCNQAVEFQEVVMVPFLPTQKPKDEGMPLTSR